LVGQVREWLEAVPRRPRYARDRGEQARTIAQGLHQTERFALMVFADFEQRGESSPSLRRLAKVLGVSTAQALTVVSNLNDLGLLVVVTKATQRRPTIYRVELRASVQAELNAGAAGQRSSGVTPAFKPTAPSVQAGLKRTFERKNYVGAGSQMRPAAAKVTASRGYPTLDACPHTPTCTSTLTCQRLIEAGDGRRRDDTAESRETALKAAV
jgi:hypothetical protein